jgi:hypothetical protein
LVALVRGDIANLAVAVFGVGQRLGVRSQYCSVKEFSAIIAPSSSEADHGANQGGVGDGSAAE